MHISGIAVVSSMAIPKTVLLSSLQYRYRTTLVSIPEFIYSILLARSDVNNNIDILIICDY